MTVSNKMLILVLEVVAMLAGAHAAALHFNENGTFKLVQFADLHFGEPAEWCAAAFHVLGHLVPLSNK